MLKRPGLPLQWAALGLVLVGVIVILGVAQLGQETAAQPLPTQMVLPTQPLTLPPHTPVQAVLQPTALLPTPLSTETPAPEVTAVLTRNVQPSLQSQTIQALTQPDLFPPAQPVPNQLTIQFAPGTPPEEQLAYIAQVGGTIEQNIAAINTVVLKLPDAAVAQALPRSSVVVQSEPDYYVVAQQSAPNDTLFNQQWALPVMDVPQAWPLLPADTPSIAVAVIDSGICANHPDLTGRILPGYDFVQDDTTPQDEYDHGCGVAGIIAANANNGMGIAGVAPNTRIMPLRVLNAQGSGTYSDVAAAIIYATDNGAQIINLSLGGANPSATLQNAVNYAVGRGVLVIAAAGNTGATSNPAVIYPAAYTDVVAVGSVDTNLQRSNFSSYGPQVDLLAPGRDIMTTRIDGNYGLSSGTSFAAPQVTGIAALEMAQGRTLVQDGGVVRVSIPTPPTPTVQPTEQVDKNGNPISQSVENQPIPTDTWAVILEPGSDPNAVAAQLGFENLGQIGTLENTYLLRSLSSASSLQAAQDTASALEAVEQVIWFEQQFAQQQFTRTPDDEPLYLEDIHAQWHLRNSFGVSLNLPSDWVSGGSTGAGVQIAIVDDGLQYTHPDLQPNYNSWGSCDYNDSTPLNTANCNDFDPSPDLSGTTCSTNNCHGTAVAGVAAAADNPPAAFGVYEYCGVGVAYGADLAGIRLIGKPSTPAQEASALTYEHFINDVYSSSWGPSDNGVVLGFNPLVREALWDGTNTGRKKIENGQPTGISLGNIYVWSAGNGRQNADNINADGYANSRFVIAVGATDATGVFTYYSEPGAAMLVTAPSSSVGLGIATTDLQGDAGYNYGGNGVMRDCTNGFGGTSASAPMVAGVVALMLEANPNVTWRDVQHILVNTARQNHPQQEDWTLNGAGLHINHNYGFGLVDAAAAVNLADAWTNVAPEVSAQTGVITVNQPIPDNNPTGVTSTVTLDSNISIERVEVVFNAQHSYRGNIEVTLTSPHGTRSRLMEKRPNDNSGAGYVNWTFSSVRHWGEHSAGEWTLKVSDAAALNTGTFQDWKLVVYGTAAPPRQPDSIAPADGATINSPLPWNATTLSWNMNGVVGPDKIELQLDTVNPPVATFDLSPSSSSEVRSLPLGTYFWRIRAVDDDPNTLEPDWSEIAVRTFTIATSDTNAPSRNYFTTGAPVLTWIPLSWATGYQIEISNSSTFSSSTQVYEKLDTAPTFTVNPPLGTGVYYWRVRGRKPDGTWSTVWSKSDSFVVDLSSP